MLPRSKRSRTQEDPLPTAASKASTPAVPAPAAGAASSSALGRGDGAGGGAARRVRLRRKTPCWLAKAGPSAKQRKLQGPLHDEAVRALVELLCDTGRIELEAQQLGFDEARMPLADLSKEHLRNGFVWLSAIEQELTRPEPKASNLQRLTASFYEAVVLRPPPFEPTPSTSAGVGYEERSLPPIASLIEVATLSAALEGLSNVEVAYARLLKLAAGSGCRKIGAETNGEDLIGAALPASSAASMQSEAANSARGDAEVLGVDEQLGSVKRPKTPYFQWYEEHRATIVKEMGIDGKNICLVSKQAGQIWRSLSAKQREPYAERYAAGKQEHDEEKRQLKEKRAIATEAVDPRVQRHYRFLSCDLETVAPDSEVWTLVKQCFCSSVSRSVEALQIFSVSRPGESKPFAKTVASAGRKLLWHTVPLSSWPALLSGGLRLPPQEAPSVGRNFGRGLYFYDMSEAALCKRAGYFFASHPLERAVLLLAEVALGKVCLFEQPHTLRKLPAGCSSAMGCGAFAPDPKRDVTLPDGATLPMGPGVRRATKDGSRLQFNEYVVYQLSQVKMRYLVDVQFAS